MRILFNAENIKLSESFIVTRLYFKEIALSHDGIKTTKKNHYHTGLEIHIIVSGCQEYEVDGERFKVSSGNYIVIPPMTNHRMVGYTEATKKYSLVFTPDKMIGLKQNPKCILQNTDNEIIDNIDYIKAEYENYSEFSDKLIECRVIEILSVLARTLNLENQDVKKPKPTVDIRVNIVKEYISDNIDEAFSLTDIARYCFLSEKQLSRIFFNSDGISLSNYIKNQRILRIENLLLTTNLTLKEISEKMNFGNEYYFNTFFKKHEGMAPGEYRKMIV